MIVVKILIGVLCLIVGFAVAEDRKVDVIWNPGCDGTHQCNTTNDRGSYSNLVHVQLTGSTDVVHLLYSDISSFSVIIARTNLTTTLIVDWDKLLSGNESQMVDAIQFSEHPLESSGYLVSSIYEFDDANGTADMSTVGFNQTFAHLTKNLIWKKFSSNSSDNFGVFEGS